MEIVWEILCSINSNKKSSIKKGLKVSVKKERRKSERTISLIDRKKDWILSSVGREYIVVYFVFFYWNLSSKTL